MGTAFCHNLNMFKTETRVMNHPTAGPSQRNNFGGAIGLLAVAAFGSVLRGSLFGFMVMGALICILLTRAAWARIVTLVIVGYVGAVGLLVSLFARANVSLSGFVVALIAVAIFWVLLRPGMSQFFRAGDSTDRRAYLT